MSGVPTKTFPFSEPLLTQLFEIYEHCNRTEIFQLCVRSGLNVNQGMTREQLITAMIAGEDGNKNAIDSWRDGIMAFLLDNWRAVKSQLDCPAKSGDPKACYGCVDTQVLFCAVNSNNEKLIQIKMSKEPT